jgi:hypothetical protein
MKSRGTRWAGHMSNMEKKKNACKVMVKKQEERNRFGDQGVDIMIILK